MTGVHLAAFFELTGVIMALLKKRHNPNHACPIYFYLY